MLTIPKMSGTRVCGGLPRAFFLFLGCLLVPWVTVAQDNEHDLLNRLYREIIDGAAAGSTAATGPTRPAGVQPVPVSADSIHAPSADPAASTTEQEALLQSRIETLMHEAEQRHSDAVKFMQDTK
jgi:hypothetical protein